VAATTATNTMKTEMAAISPVVKPEAGTFNNKTNNDMITFMLFLKMETALLLSAIVGEESEIV